MGREGAGPDLCSTRRCAKGGAGGGCAGFWTRFLFHRAMSQQFLPASKAQKLR